MGRMACTEPQCLYKGALYLYLTNIYGSHGCWGDVRKYSCRISGYRLLIVLFYVLFVLFYVLFVLFYVLFVSIVLFCVLFVCKCVLYYCHRVATQLQLNIST
jgi:hypothetical protein